MVDVIEAMRQIVRRQFVTYVFATDADGRLVGVVTFRELLYAHPASALKTSWCATPFLHPETRLVDAMHEVVTRHFPVYPVCDDSAD